MQVETYLDGKKTHWCYYYSEFLQQCDQTNHLVRETANEKPILKTESHADSPKQKLEVAHSLFPNDSSWLHTMTMTTTMMMMMM